MLLYASQIAPGLHWNNTAGLHQDTSAKNLRMHWLCSRPVPLQILKCVHLDGAAVDSGEPGVQRGGNLELVKEFRPLANTMRKHPKTLHPQTPACQPLPVEDKYPAQGQSRPTL